MPGGYSSAAYADPMPRSRPSLRLSLRPSKGSLFLFGSAAAALGLATTLAGCGVRSEQDPASDPTPTENASQSISPTPSPSLSPTQGVTPSATPTSTAASGAPLPLAQSLLTNSELPAISGTSPWASMSDKQPTQDAFGVCAKFDLLSIGATDVKQRDFTAQGAKAAEQVAEFPDAMNTQRARKVLMAWHKGCASRVPNAVAVRVGPLRQVPVPSGSGTWYLVRYTNLESGMGHFSTTGIATVGTRIAVVTMDHDGQDHNYPAGQDPMVAAVSKAGTKIG